MIYRINGMLILCFTICVILSAQNNIKQEQELKNITGLNSHLKEKIFKLDIKKNSINNSVVEYNCIDDGKLNIRFYVFNEKGNKKALDGKYYIQSGDSTFQTSIKKISSEEYMSFEFKKGIPVELTFYVAGKNSFLKVYYDNDGVEKKIIDYKNNKIEKVTKISDEGYPIRVESFSKSGAVEINIFKKRIVYISSVQHEDGFKINGCILTPLSEVNTYQKDDITVYKIRYLCDFLLDIRCLRDKI